MKGLFKLFGLLLGILGLSSKASSKKKVEVKKVDTKIKQVKKNEKQVDKKLKEVKKKQAKARTPRKRKPVKTSKEAEAFLKDFAKKK